VTKTGMGGLNKCGELQTAQVKDWSVHDKTITRQCAGLMPTDGIGTSSLTGNAAKNLLQAVKRSEFHILLHLL